MGDNAEIKTGSSSAKPPANGDGDGPIIEESQESEEYQEDLQVVLGTAFGVIAVVGLISLTFLLYRIYRARRQALSYAYNDDHDSFERNVSVDTEGKSQPVVLLLYAYDCPIHERVIAALAGFLMEACGVTVTLDLLEENDIVERGIDDWLVDRLQEADYILVLCSIGARLRCSKKRLHFKQDGRHILPDYFAVAVDYVAEKMKAEKQKGLSMTKFITAYMEYSTRSDIPPQLEQAFQFCLMKDIHNLHIHLNASGPDSDKSDSSSQHSNCENHYQETETGAVLKATIEQAKAFFKENPSWMDDCIEPTVVPHFLSKGGKSRKRRRSSMEQPLLMLTGAPEGLQYYTQENDGGKIMNCTTNNDSRCYQTEPQGLPSLNFSCPPQDLPVGSDAKLCSTLPWTKGSPRLQACEHYCLIAPGMFQNRQNSLPSSLTSSCMGMPALARHALSKSMDSFAKDPCLQFGLDGMPCLHCGNTHMDGMPECRRYVTGQKQESIVNLCQHNINIMSSEASQSSCHLPVTTTTTLCQSRSQTVLQAEVHQEWGTNSSRGSPEKKSATFAGNPRSWNSSLNVNMPLPPFQSLPPHYAPPPLTTSELQSSVGLQKWYSGNPDLANPDGLGPRSLSQTSISTEDAESASECDSLERDLQSIQKISSFHDFVISTSFTGGGHHTTHKSFLTSPSVEVEPIVTQLKTFNILGKHVQRESSLISPLDTFALKNV